MGLHGHRILIVESARLAFARSLRKAMERAGAETFIAHDAVTALEQAREVALSGAVLSARHSTLVRRLRVPVLLYGTRPPSVVVPYVFTPARPAIFVSALERLLSRRP